MKSQELIASVIDAQQSEIEKRPLGLTREIIDTVPSIENFATILTGIRRCGKSTLMLQILKKTTGKMLFLNFEDIRLSGFETSDFVRLNAEIEKRNVRILFFVEIQMADKWEIFIHQKLNEGYLVYISGSNASMLSRELGTHLTGRHLSMELYPFSYPEFLAFNNLENTVVSFDDYLQTGGMPDFVKHRSASILLNLLDDILYRDIAVRHNIRNVNGLRELTVYLLSNIGRPVSARRLTGLFGITATSTITEYFSHVSNSYLVDFVPQFDYNTKAQSRNPKKVYAIDPGIYNQAKTAFSDDSGRQLENAVFLHLRRRYQDIFFFNKQGECDFVVMEKGKAVACIQVCWKVDDMNMKREISGLKTALDYFGLREGIIVTHDQSDLFEVDGTTIKVVPAREFMA
ncbi:MAG: ATP-binding protein [Bacteroidota bacterium]